MAVYSSNARTEAAMNYSYLCCACLSKLFTLKVIRRPPQQGVCSTSSNLKITSSFQVAVIAVLQANAPLNISCINALHLVYVSSVSDHLRAYVPVPAFRSNFVFAFRVDISFVSSHICATCVGSNSSLCG